MALYCYQCDSAVQTDCMEEFDHAHKDQLTVKSSECTVDASKYCIKTTGVWGGVVGTTRFCSSRDMGNQCQFIRYPDHDRVYRACIYTCKGHHCNHAHTVTGYTVLVTLLVAMVTVMIR
ncbi:hypothetical protein NP493_458g03080 [Ridgeia piscesae]|uniref:Protein sleepless n=1 Tax=Ridgeia piscesae TaxID=27915 RepID=A0AAD9KYX1_RIDPI|nr:hypothetical protein NP493_458g03080 [Ridgeia piscesae]